MPRGDLWPAVLASLVLVASCGAPAPEERASSQALVTYPEIHGTDFPPRTLAFTYDDGPDAHTLELARYLHDRGVPATFFVVGCRIQGQAASGSPMCAAPTQVPPSVLGDLVALGHRVANHSQHHLNLETYAGTPRVVHDELASAQSILDPYVTDGVYLFRAPYNNWSAADVAAARQFPDLDRLQGSFQSDMGVEDWSCSSKDRGSVPNRTPEECAQICLASIRRVGRGIVGLHDRLEYDPGSDYALRLTRLVVDALQAEGGWKFVLLGPARAAVPCASAAACRAGEGCFAGACTPLLPDGAGCAAPDRCRSGHCVDGVCCDAACDGQCEACDAADHVGACSPVSGAPHGGRTACVSDGSACGGACDGTSRAACAYPEQPGACHGGHSCASATCADVAHAIAGGCAAGAAGDASLLACLALLARVWRRSSRAARRR